MWFKLLTRITNHRKS